MKFEELLNENNELLNEGALTDFLTGVFKGFKRTIGSTAETLLGKALNDVAQGAKRVTMASIRKNSSYIEALKNTVAEASRVKYNKSFDELLKFDKNAATNLVNDVQTAMEKELTDKAALSKTIIDKDVADATKNVGKTQKAVNAGKATQQDLKNATKELISNTKLQTKYAEVQKAIAGMDKMTAQKIANLLKKEAKVLEGTGGDIVGGGVRGEAEIFTGGRFFTISSEKLKQFPGKVKRVIVNNPVKSTLIGAGLTAAALYYFFGGDADAVIVTDENGNKVGDFGNQWANCIQELLKSKEGQIVKDSQGAVSVLVKTSEYPQGVQFYSNGRVMNVETKKMGSWKCTNGSTVIKESQKISLVGLVKEQLDNELSNDVETMIDLLDFPVSQSDLVSAGTLLKKYVDNGKGKQFLDLYQKSGLGGGDLNKTLSNIVTVNAKSVQAKNYISQLVGQIASGGGSSSSEKVGLKNIQITWDGEKKKGDKPKPKKEGMKYHDCSNKDFPFEFGCIAPKIAEIQGCLGVTPQKGYFGPKTLATLKAKSLIDSTNTITKETYDKVAAICGKSEEERKKMASVEPIKSRELKMPQISGDLTKLPNLQPIDANNGQRLYEMLSANYGDGTNPQYPYIFKSGGRLKYKGDGLPQETLDALNEFISTLGYRFMKEKPKEDYEMKYVWIKQ